MTPLVFSHTGAVLIVDDDVVILRLLERQLKPLDCSVITCSDPKRALDHVKCGNICVVITDVSMPEISGFALLRRIREEDPDLPVVLMTGRPVTEVTSAAAEYGAFAFLRKPFDAQMLRVTVNEAAQFHRLAKSKHPMRVTVDSESLD